MQGADTDGDSGERPSIDGSIIPLVVLYIFRGRRSRGILVLQSD